MINEHGSPTIQNCLFTKNVARWGGAGIYNIDNSHPLIAGCEFAFNTGHSLGNCSGIGIYSRGGSSPMIIDCFFHDNLPTGISAGGVVFAIDALTHLTVINSTFMNNESVFGAAILFDTRSGGELINCKFLGNHASISGGGIYAHVENNVTLLNSVFSGNSAADRGGALRAGPYSTLVLENCTIAENYANLGGGLYTTPYAKFVSITNSVFRGNTTGEARGLAGQIYPTSLLNELAVDYSSIEGLEDQTIGIGNNSSDPLFVNALGPDGTFGTSDDDLRLSPGSPCIDAADNTAVSFDALDLDVDNNTTERTPIDLDGNPRFLDDAATVDTGSGTAPIVDMGAYEFIIDCNENHIPDSVDIASGTSPDVNQDGVPDECGQTAAIVDATPPTNAIDSRQPHNLNGSNATGWYFVRLTLSNANQSVGKSQFEVSEQGGDGIAPGIAAVSVQGTQALVLFSTPIEPGTWTTVTHIPSGTSTRVGYLPGDVNGDGAATPVDILALIDSINGVTPRPDYATDINRDGTTAPADILREIDLLNGADAFEPWLGRSLP